MSDREQLLFSILTQPGEDTPRLALADWLDEFGGRADGARARFIRAQIERVRLGDESPTGPSERALFALWGHEWLPHFGRATHSHVRVGNPVAALSVVRFLPSATELVHFDRGFPARYLLAAQTGRTADQFAKRAAALFAVSSVECFELEVSGCEPWVEVRVGPDAGSWRAEAYLRAGGPSTGPLDELRAPDRWALAAGFERWVRAALADVCFELTDEELARGTGFSTPTRTAYGGSPVMFGGS